jgi:small neutral amino acid transporter SnatA (MarC family)
MKLLNEILNTFSNKPSLLSSKRIERFAVFASMLFATLGFMFYHIFKCSLNATDLIIIVATWLGYAGFNTVQIKKDKKDEPNQ